MTYYILGLAILKMTSWLALRARAYMLSCDAWGVLTGLLNRVSHVTVGRSRLPWSGVPIACPRCTCNCGLAHSIGAWQLLVGAYETVGALHTTDWSLHFGRQLVWSAPRFQEDEMLHLM